MSNFDFENLNNQIEQDFAAASTSEQLEALRIKYLGRKGIVAGLTSRIVALPVEQRPEFGRRINRIKQKISSLLAESQQRLGALSSGGAIKKAIEDVDMTLPGITQALGHCHLITQTIEEICGIFVRLGFVVVEGPEIESEYNNFTALNIPLEHPSRDVFDTFYLKPFHIKTVVAKRGKNQRLQNQASRLLLRSHTSPVQIRVMRSRKPPLAVVVPGKVYRPDAVDASHSFMFHQIEGFMVDYNIAFSDLKGILELFAKSIFGEAIKMRFRPHFFPFTEPSAEVDISCILCKGKRGISGRRIGGNRCPVCHGKGWLEILGSGMIHPNVFKQVGYSAGRYSGFAFGMGVERIAMLKHGINDIRIFFENDLRFLRQF